MTKRMQFIPDLQASITKSLVEEQKLPASVVASAFDRWHAGQEPATPYERGCFEVFKTVQQNVETM